VSFLSAARCATHCRETVRPPRTTAHDLVGPRHDCVRWPMGHTLDVAASGGGL